MSVWVLIQRVSAAVVAVTVVAIVIGYFYPRLQEYRDLQRRQERAQEEIRFQDELIKHLKTKQERLLNDPAFVERIAREEQGLAKSGELVFKFAEDNPTNPPGTR